MNAVYVREERWLGRLSASSRDGSAVRPALEPVPKLQRAPPAHHEAGRVHATGRRVRHAAAGWAPVRHVVHWGFRCSLGQLVADAAEAVATAHAVIARLVQTLGLHDVLELFDVRYLPHLKFDRVE